MDNLLGTLLLVLPGLLSLYLIRLVGPSNPRSMTDLERTVFGLMYNVPGMTLVWIGVSIRTKRMIPFKEFLEFVQTAPNFILYLLIVLVMGIVIANWWESKGLTKIYEWVDKHRSDQNRPIVIQEAPWEKFVGTENDIFCGIYPIGEKEKMIVGLVYITSTPGATDKGMLLKYTKETEYLIPYLGYPIRTYIDTASKVVYEMYPISSIEEARDREEQEYRATLT